MDCANCGRANRAGAKFCGGCGRPLAPRCPACGSESQPNSQFCDACGAPLVASPASVSEARKVVTIVFADLIGSTALHERLDAESARRFMERYYRGDARRGRGARRHGRRSCSATASWRSSACPRVAEDDAIRAVRAAVAMQAAFRELADEQRARSADRPARRGQHRRGGRRDDDDRRHRRSGERRGAPAGGGARRRRA